MEEQAHKAIFDALVGAGLTVRDHVPEPDDAGDEAAFPYVVIGEGDTSPHDTDDTIGCDVYFDLRFFSRYLGWKQIDQMTQTARVALHQILLDVDGFACWDVQCERAERVPEKEPNKTREARLRVVVRLDET
jgi:uncharacterized protein DUF3168